MRRRVVGTIAMAGLGILALAVLASSVPLPDGAPASAGDTQPHQHSDPRPGPRMPFSLPLGPLFAAAIALLAVGALIALYRVVGTPSNPTVSPVDAPDETEAPSLDAVADAAGDAADRLERSGDAALENEVYRAWREMTAHLALSNRRAKTPGEFAEAATRAGMNEEDVRALTRLFEDVRYGERAPTDDDERRAIDLLRRIESTYREEG